MPVYRPDKYQFQQAMESISRQTYTNWEICICDDSGDSEDILSIVPLSIRSRVRIARHDINQGISAASNTAARLSSGSWLVLMDQDDVITADCLQEIASAIAGNPDASLVYSDEDKIEGVSLTSPYFKTAYNPLLLLGHNCISHIGAYRKSYFHLVGGFDSDYSGSQDWDLALKVAGISKPSQIVHIPKVLYHWRIHPNSTAGNSDQKPYAITAGRRAVEKHIRDHWQGVSALVESKPFGNKVTFTLKKKPSVQIIIPTIGKEGMILTLLQSLKKIPFRYKVTVVDNGIQDKQLLKKIKRSGWNVSVVTDRKGFNYSRLNNEAAARSKSEFICLLNDDIEALDGDWLTQMIAVAMQPWCGIVGAKLLYPDRTVQHGGVIIGMGGVAGHAFHKLPENATGYFNHNLLPLNRMAVTGACMVMRRKLWEEVGGLDEGLAVAFNDVDLCIRVHEAGYINAQQNNAVLLHKESASRGSEDTPEKKARFRREVIYILDKNGGKMPDDPYFPKAFRQRQSQH